MTVDIVIHGAGGRMGREIARTVLGDPAVRLVGCLEQPGHSAVGRSVGSLCGLDEPGVLIQDSVTGLPLSSAVVIDFSLPPATLALLGTVESRARGMVIRTTGFSPSERERVLAAARTLPVLMSPNMSLGVNLLFHLAQIAAARLGADYDIEIIEAHHRHKKDAPSGTAVRLGQAVAAPLGLAYDQAARHGRVGITGERSNREIGMHAVRGGDILGDHTVLFAGEGERVELRHMAHSRATFARGAVAAAKWLAGREPGLYSMGDVLGF